MEGYAYNYDEDGREFGHQVLTAADLINALRRFGEHDLADDVFREEMNRREHGLQD